MLLPSALAHVRAPHPPTNPICNRMSAGANNASVIAYAELTTQCNSFNIDAAVGDPPTLRDTLCDEPAAGAAPDSNLLGAIYQCVTVENKTNFKLYGASQPRCLIRRPALLSLHFSCLHITRLTALRCAHPHRSERHGCAPRAHQAHMALIPRVTLMRNFPADARQASRAGTTPPSTCDYYNNLYDDASTPNFGTVKPTTQCFTTATSTLQSRATFYQMVTAAAAETPNAGVLLNNETFIAQTLGVFLANGCKASSARCALRAVFPWPGHVQDVKRARFAWNQLAGKHCISMIAHRS